jgi:putative membrane protein
MTGDTLWGIYCGTAPLPPEIWGRWNLDPLVLAMLGALALAVGRNRAGLAGVAVLAVAFVSPLCALSAALFSARVVHHVLLVAVAAPLLAMVWPLKAQRPVWPAFLVSTALLWGWHVPAAYDLALGHYAVYWVMQASLLGSAVLFWRAVLSPVQMPGQALPYALAGFMQMAFLGALLTLAPDPLYAIHQVAPLGWGFTPLGDQQLGGLIMWVPAGIPYIAFGALVARRGWRGLAGRTA